MPHIPAPLRRRVIAPALDRCEYCLLSQVSQEARFHIDHVVPVVAGGPTQADNLRRPRRLPRGSLATHRDRCPLNAPRGRIRP